METLFLDFCSHRKRIALVKDSVTVAESEHLDHFDEAEVMPAIEALLQKAGTLFSGIGRIAAVTGPGGFMSQRVGLAVSNALAWSLKIPIGALHLADLYAARIQGDVLWVHSTKKQLLFIRGFGSFESTWPEPILITLDELKTVSGGSYVGEVLPEQAAVLQITPLSSLKNIADVLPDVLATVAFGSTPLVPWYGRGA